MASKRHTPAAAILFTLLFAFGFLNNELFSVSLQHRPNILKNEFSVSQNTRLPASGSVDWEAQLIKKYTSGFKNQSALIVGKRPDTFDNFTFGTLNGSYAINYSGGKISGLEFNENKVTSTPQVIDDTYSFLLENKNIIAVEFTTIAKINERHINKKIIEEYGLFDANMAKVATAEIESDQDHHFLTLKIAHDGHIASN